MSPGTSAVRISLGARLILVLAGFRIAATLLDLAHHGGVPDGLHLAYILVFGTAALALIATGSEDLRTTYLAGFFLIIAATFCRSGLKVLVATEDGVWLDLASQAQALKIDGFLPFFLWAFVRTFPETAAPLPRLLRRLLAAGIAFSAWSATFFLATRILLRLLGEPALPPVLAWLGPHSQLSDFLVAILLVPPLPILLYKARHARPEVGRRIRLFVGAFVIGLAPSPVIILGEFVSARYREAVTHDPTTHLWVTGVEFAFLVTLPLTTAYAVLVHHVLPVRLMARQAVRYALARYALLALAWAPFCGLAIYAYSHQTQTVGAMFAGPRFLLFAATGLLGYFAQRYRGRVLETVDRRFFREQYDARQILTLMVQRIRATKEVREVADLLCRGIDQALHLERVGVLVEEPRSGHLVDPRQRSRKLDASAALVQRMASATDPLPIDLDNPRSPLLKLPESDRHWLQDAGYRLLVPIVARDGSLLGLIGLGEKKSGLPFLREDRKLLVDIAGSAALGMELELRQPAPHPMGEDDSPTPIPAGPRHQPSARHRHDSTPENAKECLSCGALYLPYTVFCGNCSRRLEPSVVPYVLPGKFRFERRLGAGGMGVVYRGIDLGLGRPVAAKTLKRVSPEDAMRLRREARTAAAVSHPHLAGVYGLETWQGTPLLIMELMEAGTLTQRIEKGKFDARQAVELGIAMAAALEHLHQADILHRDIKPSNIGYTRDGVPKLMDFGIARLLLDLRPDHSDFDDEFDDDDDSELLTPTALWEHSPTSATLSRQLVGTLSYLSPEALQAEQPNASFDLWGLAVVLYECVLGRKLFAGMDMKLTMSRIRQGRVPDYEQTCPDLDPALGQFFRSALHRTPSRRPGSAREMREALEAVERRLVARPAAEAWGPWRA